MTAPSIRRSLLIRCGLGIGALSAILSAGIYLLVKESLFRELDDSIRGTAAILANQVELENGTITYEWQEGLGTNLALIDGALFQFWDEASGAPTRSPALQDRDLPKFSGMEGAPLIRSVQLSDGHHARAIGLRVTPFVLPEEKEAMAARGQVIDPAELPQTLVVARDAEPVYRSLDRLRWLLAGGFFLTLGAGFFLIARAIRISLNPIHQLATQVQNRTGWQLDQVLDLPDNLPSELSGLANNFNLLLERVAATRRREGDFIRHAAHELRTPIAGLQATTDLALSQSRDAVAYVRHLETCQKTAVELGELVKRLTALARSGQPAFAGTLVPLDVGGLLRECAGVFEQAAAERGLSWNDKLEGQPLMALADPALVRIVFNNLLDNSVSYASAGGEISFSGQMTAEGVEVSIANTIGDSPDDIERWFEPLFRRDSSRHDAVSHLGIGLTLSRDAANAMGGALTGFVDSGLIRFTLALPR